MEDETGSRKSNLRHPGNEEPHVFPLHGFENEKFPLFFSVTVIAIVASRSGGIGVPSDTEETRTLIHRLLVHTSGNIDSPSVNFLVDS